MAKQARETIAVWLSQNGYDDVLALIREAEAVWRAAGVRTRRNWWQVLAGTLDGEPSVQNGVAFPILAAARKRRKWPPARGARVNPGEAPPPKVWKTGRWKL